MTEEDLLSAEIEIVPAGKARDLGIDKSMVIAYGHDDRVCSYAAVKAILDIEKPQYTAVALCVDKEEIGFNGNTGMHSKFFENTVAELNKLRRKLLRFKNKKELWLNSKVLSGDVHAGIWSKLSLMLMKKQIQHHMGQGVAIK